jgi:hypothetical protein
MKTIWTILLLAGSAQAAEIRVSVSVDEIVRPAVIQRAQAEAAWMLSKIGVTVQWGNSPRAAIRISFAGRVPKEEHPGALAYAHPFAEGTAAITVLYDRIRFLAELRPGFEQRLLAHVLVHEIGHILLRTDAHSETGVMKAHWTVEDYDRMAKAPLAFTAIDRELIVGRR